MNTKQRDPKEPFIDTMDGSFTISTIEGLLPIEARLKYIQGIIDQ